MIKPNGTKSQDKSTKFHKENTFVKESIVGKDGLATYRIQSPSMKISYI